MKHFRESEQERLVLDHGVVKLVGDMEKVRHLEFIHIDPCADVTAELGEPVIVSVEYDDGATVTVLGPRVGLSGEFMILHHEVIVGCLVDIGT